MSRFSEVKIVATNRHGCACVIVNRDTCLYEATTLLFMLSQGNKDWVSAILFCGRDMWEIKINCQSHPESSKKFASTHI